MPVNSLEAKKRAQDLLTRAGIFRPPVPVEELAQGHAISIEYIPLDDELSGMALIKDNQRIIVVNSNHHPNRQRFTIAHELAHHILHYEYLTRGAHVDKAILRRDNMSGSGIDQKERTANAFAAELLMPEMLINSYLHRGFDFHDEATIDSVAKLFGVSAAALHFRLSLPPPQRQIKLL